MKDRINKIKTDDSMDMETKNELMQAMNQQLADVQAQLAQERMNQQKDTLMQKKKMINLRQTKIIQQVM